MQKVQPAIPTLLKGKRFNKSIRIKIDKAILEGFQHLKSLNSKQLINSESVKDYIYSIYKQYDIPNPTQQNVSVSRVSKISKDDNSRMRASFQAHSSRKAARLKDSFLNELGSNQTRAQTINKTSIILSPNNKRIEPVFRYCFVCQNLILENNIQYHQQSECHQFSKVYDLSLLEIKQKLKDKIYNHTKKLRELQMMAINRQQRAYKEDTDKSINNYLVTIENSIEQFYNKQKIKREFLELLQKLEHPVIQIIEVSKKLEWFCSMYMNIKEITNKHKQQNAPDISQFVVHHKD